MNSLEIDAWATRISFVVVLAVIGLGYWLYWRSVAKKQTTVKGPDMSITVTPAGMIQLRPEHIALNPNVLQTGYVRAVVPQKYRNYLGTISHHSLATALIKVSSGEMTNEKADLCRVLTIAGALYKYPLPMKLIIIDALTAGYLQSYLEQQAMVGVSQVSNEELLSVIGNVDMSAVNKHYSMLLPKFASSMLAFAMDETFPSIEAFLDLANVKYKAQIKNIDVLKSLCTAVASITGMNIPTAYYNMDVITCMLIYSSKEVKEPVQPALALVKPIKE